MAERPDYEKGIALLSAPAESLEWMYDYSDMPLGQGVGGPLLENVDIVPPANTVAEIIVFSFYVDEPLTWAAGANHGWWLGLDAGGYIMVHDRHSHGAAITDLGWEPNRGMSEYMVGSDVGYPIPDTVPAQMLMYPLLHFTADAPLRFRYYVSNQAGLEQYATRYLDLLVRLRVVS